MNRNILISRLDKLEKFASASKGIRLLAKPYKYINSVLFRELIYKRRRQEKEVTSTTFFDAKMHLLLPSSTDIYLTGGKSHNSEIRLTRFLLNNVKEGNVFIDIGAHYGYYSLLASKLVNEEGKVYSFEASINNYQILKKNTENSNNIEIYNYAVSDEETMVVFYEFPNLFSEYNSLLIDQFRSESWFKEFKPQEIKVKSVILDNYFEDHKIKSNFIKIDVEGAEFKVINGLSKHLTLYNPKVIMEYLSSPRGNIEHLKAEKTLRSIGYLPYFINSGGALQELNSIVGYLESHNLDSDNIVFKRENDISLKY